MLQSILFDRKQWSLQKAKDWLDGHNYKQNVDVKPRYFRFRQVNPSKNYRYRTLDIGKGIKCVMAYSQFFGQ